MKTRDDLDPAPLLALGKQCSELAVVRRYWPGQEPDLICIEHAMDSKRISEAMGFHLVLEPFGQRVGDEIIEPWPTCACYEGHPQFVDVNAPEESS